MNRGCADDPNMLLETTVCLSELSKNLSGEMHLLERDVERCRAPECETLKTVHLLRVEVTRHDCDSELAKALNGVFYVRDLVHAFIGGDGNNRGVHTGNFRWRGARVVAAGTISGITNAGTHREPVFDPCQTCDAHGYMEGRFCGSILKAQSRGLVGCSMVGTYRFRFDPGKEGGHGAISGTLEGALVCRCRTKECTDFRSFAVGSYPNPWAIAGAAFQVHDHTGAPTPSAEVMTYGAETGLNCGYRTDATLGVAVDGVEVTLLSGAAPATVDALSGGTAVASATMLGPQHTPETLSLAAPGIDGLQIHCPNNEVLLLELCLGRGERQEEAE